MLADRIRVLGLIGITGIVGIAALADAAFGNDAIQDAPTLALPAPTESLDVEIRQRRNNGIVLRQDPALKAALLQGCVLYEGHRMRDGYGIRRAREEGLISVDHEVVDAR